MGNINDFRAGDTLTSFFLVRKAECKSTNSGSKYLDMVLGDSGGEISAKMWDCTPQDEAQYVPNILVKIKGNIVEWQGKKQLKIEKIRLVNEEDGVSIRDFVPAAPYEPEEMYSELLQYAAKIGHDKIRELVGLIIDDCGERLKTYPAALQNHHSIRSGLLYHILTMLKAGERLAEVYPILDKDLLYAGIILHDIAKLDELKAGELGLASEYTTEGKLLGHIVQGIKKIEQAAQRAGLDENTSLLLQHMILSHHYEPEFGSPRRPMFPEAEVLHYLDMLDARMYDMEKALAEIQPGEFTERIWVLNNRKLYKPVK